jgi:hypothetical protein
LAELQEGYYAVNRTYEQLLGEYLSLRLTSECSTWFRSQTRHAEALHRHQHRAADDRRARRLGRRGARSYPHPTAEGRSRAQKRGQHMGRPPKLTPAQQAEARRLRAQGATLAELARSYGVGKRTISRL